jgi:hypothetical protein
MISLSLNGELLFGCKLHVTVQYFCHALHNVRITNRINDKTIRYMNCTVMLTWLSRILRHWTHLIQPMQHLKIARLHPFAFHSSFSVYCARCHEFNTCCTLACRYSYQVPISQLCARRLRLEGQHSPLPTHRPRCTLRSPTKIKPKSVQNRSCHVHPCWVSVPLQAGRHPNAQANPAPSSFPNQPHHSWQWYGHCATRPSDGRAALSPAFSPLRRPPQAAY